jgi:hypothetical protein
MLPAIVDGVPDELFQLDGSENDDRVRGISFNFTERLLVKL